MSSRCFASIQAQALKHNARLSAPTRRAALDQSAVKELKRHPMKLFGLARAVFASALATSIPCFSQTVQEPAAPAVDVAAPVRPTLNGLELTISPYATIHYSPSPEHRPVFLVGLSNIDDDGLLWGGAAFTNSFGQPCVYGFVGKKFLQPFGWERVYWNITAGIIYGYKPPYEDKVPLNHNGFSPGLIPTIGYQITNDVSAQLSALGTAGLMFNVTFRLGPKLSW